MGGKGGGAPKYDPAEGQAYLNRNPDVYSAKMDPWKHYQQHGEAEGRYWGMDSVQWPTPSLPDMSQMYQQNENALNQQQAQYEQQMTEQARRQGESQRDQLYGNYMDAANTATDYINNEVTQARANAALLGIDYQDMTDEQKSAQINDYFATLWSDSNQAQLEGLMKEWGNPTGFTEFAVTRGDGSKYAGSEGSETSVSTSTGQKPTLVTQDEEEVLGAPSILGA